MPDEPEENKPETPPNETLDQRLKRLNKNTQSGVKFVKGSRIGPISFHSTPSYGQPKVPDKPSEN